MPGKTLITRDELQNVVEEQLARTKVVDMHTRLFPASFRTLSLAGIDELLTDHYLEAEFFRNHPMSPATYWRLDPSYRADLIWRTLFVENTPMSEATRGVVAVLSAMGLDPSVQDLEELRAFFQLQHPVRHAHRVLDLAGIEQVVMTNDPFDAQERACWNSGVEVDPRFRAALRVDGVLNDWESNHDLLDADGYKVTARVDTRTLAEVRRFLADWISRIEPLYMAVSLPDTFAFPADDARTELLAGAVLPACQEADIPMALMMGVRKGVNPALELSGDASGRADMSAVARMAERFPQNRFLVSVLVRENQHELCVYARTFANIMPFGCRWFLNNPSIVEEITRERLEMLGTSFIPQHSDARVVEQLIYTWRNTRRTLAPLLIEKYRLLIEDGGPVTSADIERDVRRLFRTNFASWTPLDHVQEASERAT